MKRQLTVLSLLKHEESMGFHSRSDVILLHCVFFAQNIF